MKLSLGFKDRYMRRRSVVLEVLAGGNIDAVAKDFGVSRASVYNWVREYSSSGTKQLIRADGDRRFSMPGLTPFTTLNFIRQAVVRNPDWSADKLAEYLGAMGREIQPRTLRNIFKQLGIGTASARRSKAAEWLHGRSVAQEFSDEELDILSKLGALPLEELRGSRPGEVLVQDRVKFPKGFCDQPLALELIIDTFAPMRRIYATLGPPCDRLSMDALDEVKTSYHRAGIRIMRICTPRKAHYADELDAFDYPRAVVDEMKAGHVVRPVNAKEFDSRIKDLWDVMRAQWLAPKRKMSKSSQLSFQALDDDLEEWLQEWRSHPRLQLA